jgi:hypothetical protein
MDDYWWVKDNFWCVHYSHVFWNKYLGGGSIMAHFAKVEDGKVVDVIVVNNSDCGGGDFPASESVGQAFIASLGFAGEWKQTSYNANFRKNYAFIGGDFDAVRNAFIYPKPYLSWVLDEDTCRWQAPVPYPSDGKTYRWDEPTVSWVEVTDETI